MPAAPHRSRARFAVIFFTVLTILVALSGCQSQQENPPRSPSVARDSGRQDTAFLKASDSIYLRFFADTARNLLTGYRLPVESDFRNYWTYYNNKLVYGTEGHDQKPKAPFWTDGFFNSDQRLDYAYILIHENTGKKSLIALLSEKSGYRVVRLADDFDEEMGLATQQPAKLSYRPRADAEPAVLDMKREGIAFFMFESASSVFVWDASTNSFKRYWTSD